MKRKTPTKAVIYCRVSDSRYAAESESCQTQEQLCRAWCESQQLTVVCCHSDKAISGAKADNRPGLQHAIHDACQHRAVLVVYSLSRFARNLRECLELVDTIHLKNADFASVKENFDTASPSGELIFHIFAALQEFERRQIAQRTRDAMLIHQANGRIMSERLPYGCMVDPSDSSRMIPNPHEQKIMMRVASWRQQGYKLRAIAGRLNAGGEKFAARPVCGKPSKWTHGRVVFVLKRAEQAGLYKPSHQEQNA